MNVIICVKSCVLEEQKGLFPFFKKKTKGKEVDSPQHIKKKKCNNKFLL